MNEVCFINGSPRGKNSGSQYFIGEISKLLNIEKMKIEHLCIVDCLKNNNVEEVFEKIYKANSIIFVFPLYIDSIPSSMLDFLAQFGEFIQKSSRMNMLDKTKVPRIYAVVNSGFIEGEQNKHALKIMEHFCDRIGFDWRFGLGIGAGEFMKESRDISIESKMKKTIYEAFLILKNDIENSRMVYKDNILANPRMPKFLFMFFGNRHWVRIAKRKKVKKNELYAKPYLQENF